MHYLPPPPGLQLSNSISLGPCWPLLVPLQERCAGPAQTRSLLLTRPLQIQRQATARLREHFSQPVDTAPPRQPRLAAPVSTRRDGDQEEFEMNAMEDKVL
jgi:hypothetical protein